MGPNAIQFVTNTEFELTLEAYKTTGVNFKFMDGIKATTDYDKLRTFCLSNYFTVFGNEYTVMNITLTPRMVTDVNGVSVQEVDIDGNLVFDNVQTDEVIHKYLVNLEQDTELDFTTKYINYLKNN